MKRYAVVCLLALLLAHPAASTEYAGRPLAEALADLQAQGLQLVFSTAVVTPHMTVETEPEGNDPRAILDQILEPHGLRAEDGPGGTILVRASVQNQPGHRSHPHHGLATWTPVMDSTGGIPEKCAVDAEVFFPLALPPIGFIDHGGVIDARRHFLGVRENVR